jgi:hypothetical protein
MRLWWKDLGHSFFYKRMAPLTNHIFFSWRNSLKTLLDLQLSLLPLSVQAKRRTPFFLFGVSWLVVWKTRKNSFPLVSSFSFHHGLITIFQQKGEEVYFFFFVYICIYLSPIFSLYFTLSRIASKEKKWSISLGFDWGKNL